jgi:hypothetical protein
MVCAAKLGEQQQAVRSMHDRGWCAATKPLACPLCQALLEQAAALTEEQLGMLHTARPAVIVHFLQLQRDRIGARTDAGVHMALLSMICSVQILSMFSQQSDV